MNTTNDPILIFKKMMKTLAIVSNMFPIFTLIFNFISISKK